MSTGFDSNFILIRISSFWKITGRWRKVYQIYCTTAWILIGFFTVFDLIEAYTSLPDISKFNDAICGLTGILYASGKGWMLRPSAMNLENAQKHLDRNLGIPFIGKSQQDKNILKKTAKKAQILARSLIASAMLTGLAWVAFPFIDGTRKLPLPTWSSTTFNVNLSPNYQILYVAHTFIIFWAATCLASTAGIYCSFLMQICCQYDILQQNITKLSKWLGRKDRKDEMIDENFKKLVRHHQAITELVEDLRNIYRRSMLLQLAGAGSMIIAAGFEIFVLASSLTSRVMSRILFLFLGLSDLFVHCVAADAVYRKNEQIARAIYSIPWQNLPKRQNQFVIMMIIRSQKPSVISVGGFSPLTLATFVMVIRTAYSVFSLLRQVSQTHVMEI